MASDAESDTADLLRRAGRGDRAAQDALLVRHQAQLRKMVAYRLDRRLAARVDPSDVVQEALAEAADKLPDYLRCQPLPFYPWLRQLALERLLIVHRRHIQAQKRSVTREEHPPLPVNDESVWELADRLQAAGESPMSKLLREEMRARVQHVLAQLSARDREVLALRHLEQLSIREMAAVLGITEGAVKTRHLRALQRFRELLGEEQGEEIG